MRAKDKKLPKSGATRFGHSSHIPGSSTKFLQRLDNTGFFEARIAKERRMLGLKKERV